MAFPLVAAAALSAAGSLGSQALQYAATNKTNKTNQAIARENNAASLQVHREDNAFNRQERLEAQEWNREQWLMQQQYNSPVMQAERLRQAGLNPLNIMDGDSAQTVGQVASSSPASAASAPTFQQPQLNVPQFGFLNEAAQNIAQTMKLTAEAKRENINNESLMQRLIAELDGLYIRNKKDAADTNKSKQETKESEERANMYKAQRDGLIIQNDRNRLAYSYDQHIIDRTIRQFDDQHRQAEENIKLAQFDNKMNELYGQPMREAQLRSLNRSLDEISARIAVAYAQKGYLDADAKKVVAEKAESEARKLGIDKQNKQFDDTKDFLRQEIINRVQMQYPDVQAARDYQYGRNHSGIANGLAGAASYVGGLLNSVGIRLKF